MTATLAAGEGLILLADDDRILQATTAKVLRNFGYRVIVANNGEEALRLARDEQPDLLLLDVDMPDLDGFTVCQRLRGDPATARVPVIFVSGMDDPLDRMKGFSVGASDYVTKPIHAGELNARVSAHIALRRQINDLRRLKNALWQNEVRYRLLVENTPDVFWEVDGSLRIAYLSPQCERLTGTAPGEALGQPLSALLRSPTDWLDPLRAQGGPSEVSRVEVTAFHADGSPRILDISATAMRDDRGGLLSVLGVARDITERKANERRLEQLSLAVESSPVTVAITDYNGVIESVNPSFCALTGFPEREILGEHMKVLRSGVHPASLYDNLWARLHAGETCIQDFCNRRKDNTFYWVRQSISPIFNKAGQITHFVWVGEDFTEAKRQEAALREAKETAERATQAKSDFLANMSHEIRTPMNAIIGLSHLCLKTGLDTRQHDYLSKISSAAQSLLGIINDILDFSKIEAGRLQLERTPFELSEVLGRIDDLVQPRVQEKGLSLVFRIAPDVPLRLVGDPTRLGQVLLNLCSNAVKFTPLGEIVVECALVDLKESGALLRFDVVDGGIGMTTEQQERLFMPFVQADTSTTRKYGGTGLGLTISKQIVEAMGGEIAVDSRPGQGTRFFFTALLGLEALAAGAATDDSDRPAGDAPVKESGNRVLGEAELAPLRGRRVLLVEDNAFNQQVAMELLALVGIEAELAENGREAVDKIRGTDYDLVLMDLQMPEMDGITATRVIREELQRDRLPILAMTANAMVGDRDRCLAAGMNGHIGKPIDPNGLYAQMLAWLPAASGTNAAAAAPLPAAAAPSPAVLEIPGFDTAQALGRMRGNVKHYRRMLGLFLAEFSATGETIRAALDAGDATLAKRLAHTLKGSAGTIGATDLHLAAKALDEHIEARGCADALPLLDTLSTALADAVARIKALPAE